jgi:hypothetical protein
MTVVAQKVISLFYTYVDSLTVAAYDALTTKESYLEILFTFLFLFEREEGETALCVVVQKVKLVYTSHNHRRVDPKFLGELFPRRRLPRLVRFTSIHRLDSREA